MLCPRPRTGRVVLALLFAVLRGACACTPSPPFDSAAAEPDASAGLEPPVALIASAPAPPPAPCPAEMALIGDFCIDRYEAHIVDSSAPDLPLPHSERPRAGVTYAARSRAGVKPQGYLSRIEAARACSEDGKRLCAAREWYGACRGSQQTRFPYGDKEVRKRRNTRKDHVMSVLFGVHTRYMYDAHYNNPRLALAPGFLAATGEYDGCVNDYGLFDMVGNLHEWIADDVTPALAEEVPIEYGRWGLGHDGSGAFMGGYYSSRSEHGRGCAYITATHAPDYHDYSIGFRCCRDAPR
ncbi:MAG: SUMF1/EgtB/PvdO family nonheme iron enzyme [Polyangiaceae bacterium]